MDPVRPQKTFHLKDLFMVIKPKILAEAPPVLEPSVDHLSSFFSFSVSPPY